MTASLSPETERLSTLLTSVMEQVEAAAMDLNVDLPAIRRVTTGSLAHDCEQVLVVGSGITSGTPTAPAGAIGMTGGCAISWTVVLSVDIVRESPTVTDDGTTDEESVTGALGVVSADAGVIMEALRRVSDISFTDFTASITLKAPSGNYRSTSVSIRMALS